MRNLTEAAQLAGRTTLLFLRRLTTYLLLHVVTYSLPHEQIWNQRFLSLYPFYRFEGFVGNLRERKRNISIAEQYTEGGLAALVTEEDILDSVGVAASRSGWVSTARNSPFSPTDFSPLYPLAPPPPARWHRRYPYGFRSIYRLVWKFCVMIKRRIETPTDRWEPFKRSFRSHYFLSAPLWTEFLLRWVPVRGIADKVESEGPQTRGMRGRRIRIEVTRWSCLRAGPRAAVNSGRGRGPAGPRALRATARPRGAPSSPLRPRSVHFQVSKFSLAGVSGRVTWRWRVRAGNTWAIFSIFSSYFALGRASRGGEGVPARARQGCRDGEAVGAFQVSAALKGGLNTWIASSYQSPYYWNSSVMSHCAQGEQYFYIS